MDRIPPELFKNLDNKANQVQVISDAFHNPVVLRQVLEHFSNPELLKLSFVNKLWNHEARSVMRDRGKVTARLRLTYEQPCQRIVEAFGSDLRQMNVVPFSGVSIEIIPCYHKCSTEAMSPTLDAILGQLTLRRVSIKLFENWCRYEGCPGIQLAKKVLQHFSQVVEELSFKIEYEREEFVEQVVQQCRFPSLKVLELSISTALYNNNPEDYVDFTKTLVSRTPILQELRFDRPMNSILTLLEGSSAVVVYDCEIRAPFHEILENEISALRLERIRLTYPDREFNFDRFNRITPMLLQLSGTTTLKFMSVDSVLAVPLMIYGICLKSVNELQIRLSNADQRISRIVKGLDFTCIFPNLNKVEISGRGSTSEVSSDHIVTILEQANAVLREPMPDRAANIKELSLSHYSLCNSTVQYFSEMFPTIEKLVLDRSTTDGEIPLWSIWKNWLDLKELEVRGDMISIHRNLDSVFCGLFPQEVAELRQKDDEYLKRVNIVPVWPGITCLRNLRTLTLNHEDYRTSYNVFGDDATFLFSKVTVLTAFARCPALAVNLHMFSYAVPPAMTHLKPYVSFKSTLREAAKYNYEDWSESYYYYY